MYKAAYADDLKAQNERGKFSAHQVNSSIYLAFKKKNGRRGSASGMKNKHRHDAQSGIKILFKGV